MVEQSVLRRRDFLKGSLLLFGFAGCSKGGRRQLSGDFRGGPDHHSGHLLRRRGPEVEPRSTRSVDIAVLGCGISGLSAAWHLHRSGCQGVELFELQKQAGGNSRSASYSASQAPWAAHYLPVPTRESRAVRELLKEMGLMSQGQDGKVSYNERHLCHPLQERLWYRGRWYESLLPTEDLSAPEVEQWSDFQSDIERWRKWRDKEGKKAFAIPLAESSADPEVRELDNISFAAYAEQKGWTAPFVCWLLEYATRDDYGASPEQVSAWAGLHYFACRDGGDFRDDDAIFVWPEGNGHLADYLRNSLPYPIHTRQLITAVRPGSPVEIDVLDLDQREHLRIEARRCLYCLPSFQRPYHFTDEPAFEGHYAPWVTANLVLSRAPKERSIYSEPAWDNVVFGSESLGYVVASHQTKAMSNQGENVWTWYRAFPGRDPAEVRKELLESKWEYWRDQILSDLETVHPDISEVTSRIDVALFGHGMITPKVGFIWGEESARARQPKPNVWFAHSDLSGISVFEEAQYRGVLAAQQLMADSGRSFQNLTDA